MFIYRMDGKRREMGLGSDLDISLAKARDWASAARELAPSFAEILRVSEHQMRNVPGLATAYAIIAIGFAPFA